MGFSNRTVAQKAARPVVNRTKAEISGMYDRTTQADLEIYLKGHDDLTEEPQDRFLEQGLDLRLFWFFCRRCHGWYESQHIAAFCVCELCGVNQASDGHG